MPPDQPTKRTNKQGSRPQQTPPPVDTEEVAELTPKTDVKTVERGSFGYRLRTHTSLNCGLQQTYVNQRLLQGTHHSDPRFPQMEKTIYKLKLQTVR